MTAEHVRGRLEAAGYVVREARDEPGVLRAYAPDPSSKRFGRLTAIVTIRKDDIEYAEFRPPNTHSTVFKFWPLENRGKLIERFFRLVQENPAT